MKKAVIPTVMANQPSDENDRPDKLIFSPEIRDCGGHKQCAGRRIIENYCNAIKATRGFRGMDLTCVLAMIRIQLRAINDYLGIKENSRNKQTLRVEDAEGIVVTVRQENNKCVLNDEPELSRKEVFDLVSTLLLEKLYVNKKVSRHFFGIMGNDAETKSFADLEPDVLARFQKVISQSYRFILHAEKRPGKV